MIVIHPSGETSNARFNSSGVTGYVAAAVVLNGDDAVEMVRLYERDPEGFRPYMLQFAARFKSNRQG